MAYTNILHLSDLHFSMESSTHTSLLAIRENALQGIIHTLSGLQESEKPDIVIVSGDITWQGKSAGFSAAAKWLKELLQELKLDTSRLIVCAGNHDIQRGETTGMTPPMSSNDADAWLSVENWSNFLRPFQYYNEFCEQMPLNPLLIGGQSSYLVGIREVLGLRILVMNSSWFCRGRDDRAKLWLGLPQLELMVAHNQLLKKSEYDQAAFTIAVVHHPKEWFHDEDQHTYERPSAYRYLAERSHLIFSGHVHAAPEAPSQVSGKAYVIQGGAAYAGGRYRNHFSLVKIDLVNRQAIQIPFEYDPRSGDWLQLPNEDIYFTSERLATPPSPPSPQAVNSLWNIPFRKHPNFTGREYEMTELRQKLEEDHSISIVQTISGLGGIGKTQLAAEYAYNYCDLYHTIWWVRAEDPTVMMQDLEELCRRLSLPTHDNEGKSVAVSHLHNWMKHKADWLIIFDNARNEEILNYLPHRYSGHVLITSRNPNWEHTLPLDVLSRESSVEFLLKRTGSYDSETAYKIAEELGDLPLALEQAGAYIRQVKISLTDYLIRFQEYRGAMIRRGNPLNYHTRVATTWQLSFDEIYSKYPVCRDFVEYLSFLSSDYVSRGLFLISDAVAPEFLEGKLHSVLELDDIISELREYSLIHVGEHALSMHRLVQTIIIENMAVEDQKIRLLSVVKYLLEVNKNLKSEFYSGEFINHIIVIIQHAEKLNLTSELFLKLRRILFRYHISSSEFESAFKMATDILEEGKALYVKDDPKLAICHHDLGIVLTRRGMPRDAMQEFITALSFKTINSADKANYLNSLGNAERELGLIDSSSSHLKEAVAIKEKENIYLDEVYPVLLNSLGLISVEKGLFEEAEEYYNQAISIWSADKKRYLLQIATSLSNLGSVYQDKGDQKKAITFFLKASSMTKNMYGENHPYVARDYNNTGLSYYYEFEHDRAKRYFRKALRLHIELYGPDNAYTAKAYHNLGMVFESEKDFQSAKENYERALTINKELYGEKNQHVAAGYHNLGGVLQELNHYVEAKQYLEQALQIDMEIYGDDHIEVAKDLGKLGTLKLLMKDIVGALADFNKCKLIFEGKRLVDNIDYISCIYNLGLVYLERNQLDICRKWIEQSLSLMVKNYGKQHNQTAMFINTIVNRLGLMGLLPKEKGFIDRLYQRYL